MEEKRCRWWWWWWCHYQHSKSFNMMTTTRFCALFICLLRQCRACAYAGGNNSKKNHYDHHLLLSPLSLCLSLSLSRFLFLSLSSLFSPSLYTQRDYYLIILNTCELLSIKYQVLPLESSSSSCSRTDKRTSTIRNCSFFLFEIMRQMLNCRAWICFAEKVSKWNKVNERYNVIVRVIQLSLITSTWRSFVRVLFSYFFSPRIESRKVLQTKQPSFTLGLFFK